MNFIKRLFSLDEPTDTCCGNIPKTNIKVINPEPENTVKENLKYPKLEIIIDSSNEYFTVKGQLDLPIEVFSYKGAVTVTAISYSNKEIALLDSVGNRVMWFNSEPEDAEEIITTLSNFVFKPRNKLTTMLG